MEAPAAPAAEETSAAAPDAAAAPAALQSEARPHAARSAAAPSRQPRPAGVAWVRKETRVAPDDAADVTAGAAPAAVLWQRGARRPSRGQAAEDAPSAQLTDNAEGVRIGSSRDSPGG